MRSIYDWFDVFVTLAILATLAALYFYHIRQPKRRVWRCFRFHGGGVLDTPRPMTLEQATRWLGISGMEVAHVDYEHGFIFYRPRGGS